MNHLKATLCQWTSKILPVLPTLLALAALGLFLAGCGDHRRHH